MMNGGKDVVECGKEVVVVWVTRKVESVEPNDLKSHFSRGINNAL